MDARILYSIQSALLFLVIALPFTYKLVQALLGKLITIASPSGCPTVAGVVVHAVVFGLLVYLLMVFQGGRTVALEKFVEEEEKNAV